MRKIKIPLDENYRLIAGSRILYTGSFEQVGSYVKHHCQDGRYTIVGGSLWLDCVRRAGVVEADTNGIQANLPPYLIREKIEEVVE